MAHFAHVVSSKTGVYDNLRTLRACAALTCQPELGSALTQQFQCMPQQVSETP